jgi:hypothetical protein
VSSYTSYEEQRVQTERLLQEVGARDAALNAALADKMGLAQQLEQVHEQVRACARPCVCAVGAAAPARVVRRARRAAGTLPGRAATTLLPTTTRCAGLRPCPAHSCRRRAPRRPRCAASCPRWWR